MYWFVMLACCSRCCEVYTSCSVYLLTDWQTKRTALPLVEVWVLIHCIHEMPKRSTMYMCSRKLGWTEVLYRPFPATLTLCSSKVTDLLVLVGWRMSDSLVQFWWTTHTYTEKVCWDNRDRPWQNQPYCAQDRFWVNPLELRADISAYVKWRKRIYWQYHQKCIIGIGHARIITHEGSTGAYHHSQGKCSSAWQFADGKWPASCAKYGRKSVAVYHRTNIQSWTTVYSLWHECVEL